MTRSEVEKLIDEKLAPAFALVDRVDALMARVYALLANIEAAFGASGAQGAAEQFNKLRSLVETLESAAALKSSQSEDDPPPPRRPQ